MALSITTIAPTTSLTTADRVRTSGLAFASTDEPEIERLIRSASAAIVSYCGRPFGRETLIETCPGYGDINLALTRTPIVAVDSVIAESMPITDYSIGDADMGLLYRRAGWSWTVQTYAGLSAGDVFLDSRLFPMGTPLPRQEEPSIAVTYTAGYILPSQYLIDVNALGADASDNSFTTDADHPFPSSVRANDVIETIDFINRANNGRFVVVGTPTTTRIKVAAALVTEPPKPGPPESMAFYPPAQCRPFDDVERAVFETVKSWYTGRARDSAVVERQAASTRVRFSEQEAARMLGLPATCVGLLRAWRRLQ